MKKEAIIEVPVEKSNNKLIITVIIILILLIVASLLGYLIYNYFESEPVEIDETDGSTDMDVPFRNETVPATNQTTNQTPGGDGDGNGGGGGGSGGGGTPCTPSCANKQCGDNGCGGSCGSCNFGYECNSTFYCSLIPCQDECDSEGLFCNGDMPYNCTNNDGDICLERTNLTACSLGWQCVNGTGCQEILQCNTDSDCNSLDNICSVGICNASGKCEIQYNSTTNVCRASAGECDVAEYCTGNSAACPADSFKLEGTACSSGFCKGNRCVECIYDAHCKSGEICRNEVCVSGSPVMFDGWRVLPVRSEAEFNLGKIGGEAEQHPHSIARSLYNPNVIYWSHDVTGPWKSDNSGESWKKVLGINLSVIEGQSIEVDPVNPNIVFIITNITYDWIINQDYSGLYRSVDGGDTWVQVLKERDIIYRFHRKNIAYDLSSISNGKANRWYVAFPNNGLYRSEDGGDSWGRVINLAGHNPIYQVIVHPTNRRIYIASSQGLFYLNYGESTLNRLGNLPSGGVSSVQINPNNPGIIYATLRSKGLYSSSDAGQTFSLLKEFDAQGVYMNPGYPNTLYLVGYSSNTITTHDAGKTWITNMKTVRPSGEIGTGWKGAISGELSGIVPNPQDENEAVAYSRATIWKTTDGGHYFNDSSTLFTGFAPWWQDSIEFDEYNPNRIMTTNCDVAVGITTNSWDYFEMRSSGIWQWYRDGLIGWIGSYSGDFEPVQNSQKVVASVGDYFNSQLMYSENEGRTWSLVTSGAANAEANLFVSYNNKDPRIVYAGNKISHDGGRTFSLVDFSGPNGNYNSENPSIFGVCLANHDIIYALNKGRDTVFRSDDKGESWRIYVNRENGTRYGRLDPLPSFAVDPLSCNVIYGLKDYDLAIYNGVSWRKTGVLDKVGRSSTSDLGNYVRAIAIDPRNNSIIYVKMFADGTSDVWRSLDGGYTWEDISYNRPRVGGTLAVNPHTGELLSGGAIGTWVFPSLDIEDDYLYKKGISMPSCKDTLKNGDEAGVDCGGSCLSDCGHAAPSLSPSGQPATLIGRLLDFFKRVIS